LSVEAVHDRSTEVCVMFDAVKFVGAEGACVSVVPPVMLKFVFEISKNKFPDPLTIILC
jgi:hypothetical protein